LQRARARRLPLVCANPDLVVDVGGRQYICAGAIADLYERMDGEVFWAGKPHANAYDAAQAAAEAARGAPVDRKHILAIGDSVRTDLKGAEAAGIDAIFIASGIHRDETMGSGELSPEKLAILFAPPAPRVIEDPDLAPGERKVEVAAMSGLRVRVLRRSRGAGADGAQVISTNYYAPRREVVRVSAPPAGGQVPAGAAYEGADGGVAAGAAGALQAGPGGDSPAAAGITVAPRSAAQKKPAR
jgi:hypothetical protein